MPGTMLKNLSLFCLIAIATLVAEHVFFAVSDLAAQAKPQYLVMPLQLPFGDRGARQYEALLQQLSAEGWSYDHDLPGFVVFKR
ncbi:MAG: hypothetical protein ACREVK_05390 [Gammaproteobacteria bacterium]